MSTLLLSQVGGIFALLVFWHFVADWVFQSHKEALAKSTNHWVRFRHCAVYTILFAFPAWLVNLDMENVVIAATILFMSHFVIDTYIPVMLWAKHLRRAPQFTTTVFNPVTNGWQDKQVEGLNQPSDVEAFKALFSTPVGAILCITMDQLFHIAFLLPVAWLIVAR